MFAGSKDEGGIVEVDSFLSPPPTSQRRKCFFLSKENEEEIKKD